MRKFYIFFSFLVLSIFNRAVLSNHDGIKRAIVVSVSANHDKLHVIHSR